jgi:hypothetical protein
MPSSGRAARLLERLLDHGSAAHTEKGGGGGEHPPRGSGQQTSRSLWFVCAVQEGTFCVCERRACTPVCSGRREGTREGNRPGCAMRPGVAGARPARPAARDA